MGTPALPLLGIPVPWLQLPALPSWLQFALDAQALEGGVCPWSVLSALPEGSGMYTFAFISKMQNVEANIGTHGCFSDNLLFLVCEIIIVQSLN